MFIVGIDIAKRGHTVRVVDDKGETVYKPFPISNNCSGYNVLLGRLRKLTNHKSEFIFAMEATAHYWLALYTRLRKEGFLAVLLNPIQTHALRELLIRDAKTDGIDTLVIAELIRFGRHKSSSVPQEKLLALRELCRNRTYLTELLRSASNGRFGEWKARQLRELARDSFGIPDCEGAYSALILLYLEQLQRLSDSVASLDRRIAELFSQFNSTLTSITGIGPVLGAAILSEIRDISCFASADKLAAYAGIDPRVKQSGEMKFGGVHMSRRGSPYLRRAIWQASTVAVRYDPMFRAYYEKKAAEGMGYMKIIGHVTKKMAAVIFAVMRDNKAYQPAA